MAAKIAGLSFSGADVKAYATIPYVHFKNGTFNGGGDHQLPPLVRLHDLQTISISVYREKSPVRALGHRNVRGFSRGGRTIAGSLIFALIDEHPLQTLLDTWVYEYSYDIGYWDGHNFPDQIPPFNIHLVYAAELPSAIDPKLNYRKESPTPAFGTINILGVDFTNDGMVTSIEDLLTENTYQYMARDLHIFSGDRNSRGPKEVFSSINSGGAEITSDEMRIASKIGALQSIDPGLSESQARSLETGIRTTTKYTQDIHLIDPALVSRGEMSQSITRIKLPGITKYNLLPATSLIVVED